MNNNLNKWYPACCKHFTFYYRSYYYFITCFIRTFKKMPGEWFSFFKFYCFSYILLNTLLTGIYKNYKRCSVDNRIYCAYVCLCRWVCLETNLHSMSNYFSPRFSPYKELLQWFHKMSYSVCSTASVSCSWQKQRHCSLCVSCSPYFQHLVSTVIWCILKYSEVTLIVIRNRSGELMMDEMMVYLLTAACY